jgi:hypothetical protein
MKVVDYIPCLLAGTGGAWLGAISCFFVATSDAAWALGTVAFSITCAFASMAIAKVTGDRPSRFTMSSFGSSSANQDPGEKK